MSHPAPDASTAPPAESDPFGQSASIAAEEPHRFVPGIPVVDIAAARKRTPFFGWPLQCPGKVLDRDSVDRGPVDVKTAMDQFRFSAVARSLGQ